MLLRKVNSPKQFSTVYISNVSEDVWPFISEMSDPKERAFEIAENATSLSDRDLFSFAGQHNVTLVLPSPVNPDFLRYYVNLFGNKNLKILVPKKHSGMTCEDILNDETIWKQLVQLANSSHKLSLIAYTTSPQFFKVVKLLQMKGLNVAAPESPDAADAWTVNFYGSKSGIRQFAQLASADEPDFKMANGLICMGIGDAAKIAANKYLSDHGVVLKTNKGHSGAGVLIFRPHDLPRSYSKCEKIIADKLSQEGYWSKFPIVIEKYIPPNFKIGGGFPNVEYKILKSGHVEFLFYGGMRVTEKGVYKGMEIHDEALSDKLSARIVDTGFYLGESLAKAGYRGHFDVDFIATKNGDLYVTESNVRRTGGSHVFYTSLALFGKDFTHDTYSLHNNLYELPVTKWTFTKLHDVLSPLLFNKSTKEGVVITAVNALKVGYFGYIIFGTTKKKALDIETKMETLLREKSHAMSH